MLKFCSSDENYNREEVMAALAKFGHDSFRAGQEESIRRVLCGRSTLVQLATGSGKSLVYQLPAYLYARKQRYDVQRYTEVLPHPIYICPVSGASL